MSTILKSSHIFPKTTSITFCNKTNKIIYKNDLLFNRFLTYNNHCLIVTQHQLNKLKWFYTIYNSQKKQQDLFSIYKLRKQSRNINTLPL
ncbi:hypothetical protein Q4595_04480 [Wenyingzhuangia sp. 1_MG-2023]|nr:hypothetical protein [Wenyingzhuangia sp. 1_MG-2023]